MPDVKERDSFATTRTLNVIHVVPGFRHGRLRVRSCQLVQRYDQFGRTRITLHAPDAIPCGMPLFSKRIGATRVSVAGSVYRQAGEVQAERDRIAWQQRINRALRHLTLACDDIMNNAHEAAITPVIEREPGLGRQRIPLQHRALLPIPCTGSGKRRETLSCFTIDQTDLDHIVFLRYVIVEPHPVGEHISTRFVPRRLVVIAEEVVRRPCRQGLRLAFTMPKVKFPIQTRVPFPAPALDPLLSHVA